MADFQLNYQGDLRIRATHLRSCTEIFTDAPIDNHGKGESFSPTDLVCVALGSCMLTILGIAAQNHPEVKLTGTAVDINKIMANAPRRISEIIIDVHFPVGAIPEQLRSDFENRAHACPVAQSLHPELKETIRFHY